ncbi:hypothetical protein ACJIZ3_022268 [Penstemon smallii]|uniref:ferric-chelate reductase (NADH) n=1 Tax=Penstemon smallii TaxID=265156 RepID=A0ABD3TKQ7_9LAMI
MYACTARNRDEIPRNMAVFFLFGVCRVHDYLGINLVLFSFPLMLIATLGCVYLHFQNSSPESGKSYYSHFLRRPLLVMAPLGIVNAVELMFAAMLGYIGNTCWAFLFFPVTRGSSILPLFGLTSESSIKYHIWLGHISTVLFAAHSIGFIIYWAMTNQMILMLEWSSTYLSNIAGVIAFVVSLVIWVASFDRVRRKMFEVFFYVHQLYAVYLFFYFLHVGVAYICLILPGIFLFIIDRYLRFLQSRHKTRLLSTRLLPNGTTELTFAKNPGLSYSPTSILFVHVPSICKLQWHPFTIISNSNLEPEKLSVAIKTQGSWTQKLYEQLSSLDHLNVSTEGPYGPAASDFLSHESLVMISGGSGIAPFISIIREIIFASTESNKKVPKVLLIAAFKNTTDLTMLDLLLPLSSTTLDICKLELQIEAYVTQEHDKRSLDDAKKQIQTRLFKPNPSDSPIAAALGENSWLWLGAIISSSFVLFLLLLGVITRYHIYPVEKRGENYHYSSKIIWDMFLVCVSIFVATSAIFLWQKRKISKEGKQIQNVDMPTPTMSPASWLCGTDRELESLPHQSLVQSSNDVMISFAILLELFLYCCVLGYIGNTCWAFLFFPVTRGSSILPLFGLTSESSIKYHIWLGHISTVLFAAHSIGFIIYWAMTNQMILMLEWSSTYLSNIAGVIAFVVSLVIWVASFDRVRRKMFEVFFYVHQLYAVYLFFYFLHVGVAYICLILPGIFLFIIDRYLRFLQSRHKTRLLSTRLLPNGTTELTFAKNPGLSYSPTSILFVHVPSICKLQWHPFTIISNSNLEPEKLSVAIKTQGSWTQKLYEQLSSLDHLNVSTEGPYGPAASDFLSHESLVMISGGSGIAPFISIIREIIFASTESNKKVPKVLLIAAFKNTTDLTMLDLLLPLSSTTLDICKLELQIEAYVTQEHDKRSLDDAKKQIQTRLFKPNPSDSPIAAALGENSWLWLGAIISSSFVLFLLLLGVITRYHIYPVEKRGENYHYSSKIIWDMFLVCVSIFVATSAIFLWQKRKISKEGKQIQNVDMPTPTMSPASWLCGTDRELESLPHQSLVQSSNVHFGVRPDLKRILFDCKGSDVGVLVCGPKSMRHEVAKICASGLAKSLHFESISFNW